MSAVRTSTSVFRDHLEAFLFSAHDFHHNVCSACVVTVVIIEQPFDTPKAISYWWSFGTKPFMSTLVIWVQL